jgi:hypothetical protein
VRTGFLAERFAAVRRARGPSSAAWSSTLPVAGSGPISTRNIRGAGGERIGNGSGSFEHRHAKFLPPLRVRRHELG